MQNITFTQTLAAVAAATLLLVSCGGGGGDTSSASNLNSTIGQNPTGAAPVVNISLSSATLVAGQSATLTWSTTGADTCQAWGAWGGTQVTSGSTSVTATSVGTYTYGLSCTGKGGTNDATAKITVIPASIVAGANSVPVVIDAGPTGQEYNSPYVSVTVCTPGTNACQTIDHILVDTGSYGLRLLASATNTALTPLPAVTNAGGQVVGECAQFVSGYTWGSVRRADVKVGGENAANIPIELIGDIGSAYSQVPASCSNAGANIGSVAGFGANGVLGVGLEAQDCGPYCASNVLPGLYYGCSSTGTCSETMLPVSSQVVNPVAAFPVNKNGVILSFPAVAAGGTTNLKGTLTFGIGTQSNNALGTHKVYSADSFGYFSINYKNQNYASSFIDSGSNGMYFPDATIDKCSFNGHALCPLNAPLQLSALTTGANGTAGSVSFYIDNFNQLGATVTAGSTGFDSTNISGLSGIDWGVPFFFGRTVAVGIRGAASVYGVGPYWAY